MKKTGNGWILFIVSLLLVLIVAVILVVFGKEGDNGSGFPIFQKQEKLNALMGEQKQNVERLIDIYEDPSITERKRRKVLKDIVDTFDKIESIREEIVQEEKE